MGKIKSLIMFNVLLLTAVNMYAQGPNESGTYYQHADGTKGQALKTAMYEIIKIMTNWDTTTCGKRLRQLTHAMTAKYGTCIQA